MRGGVVTDTQMFTQQRVNERIRERDLEYAKHLRLVGITPSRPIGRTIIADMHWTSRMHAVYHLECTHGHEWSVVQHGDAIDESQMRCSSCIAAQGDLKVRHVEPSEPDPKRPVKGSGVQFSPGLGRVYTSWSDEEGIVTKRVW